MTWDDVWRVPGHIEVHCEEIRNSPASSGEDFALRLPAGALTAAVSMLIPKEENKQAFMLEATKAFAKASGVFAHFACEPQRTDTLDFSAFVDTMRTLCRRHRRDSSGIEDLRATILVFDSYHEAVRQHRALDDDEFRRGLVSAQRLRWWLHQTFPDVRPHPERN